MIGIRVIFILCVIPLIVTTGCSNDACVEEIEKDIGILFQKDVVEDFYQLRTELINKVDSCQFIKDEKIKLNVPGFGQVSRNMLAVAVDDPKYLTNDRKFQFNLGDSIETTLLHFAVTFSAPKVITELLNSGVDINSLDGFGNTALITATQSLGNKDEILKFLLESGADPTIRNHQGLNYLDYTKTGTE